MGRRTSFARSAGVWYETFSGMVLAADVWPGQAQPAYPNSNAGGRSGNRGAWRGRQVLASTGPGPGAGEPAGSSLAEGSSGVEFNHQGGIATMDSDRDVSEVSESILEMAARLKEADRQALAALPPEVAQAEVDKILFPRLWHVADPAQLAWPGDLADEDDGLGDDRPG